MFISALPASYPYCTWKQVYNSKNIGIWTARDQRCDFVLTHLTIVLRICITFVSLPDIAVLFAGGTSVIGFYLCALCLWCSKIAWFLFICFYRKIGFQNVCNFWSRCYALGIFSLYILVWKISYLLLRMLYEKWFFFC